MKTDDQAAAEMTAFGDSDDTEGSHVDGDMLLCELLTELGYPRTVEAWSGLDKWFS